MDLIIIIIIIISLKVHKNPCGWSRDVSCGQAGRYIDGHDDADSRFSQLSCERA